jgi:uncharacterized protein YhaN
VKILDLHLRAFGPFTDCDLDLSGGQQGLHLIFGPNEAGKSSALRALRALLYGIPERTGDDFLHDRQDLRVGGRLRGSDGAEVHCVRRKGRKNTLLDRDGKTLPDDVLAPLLAGVDDRLFERLFGIDHEGLVSGGQALLAERGREAEALFGSGLGGVDLNAVLRRLDEEANALFLPRGTKPTINTELHRFAEIEHRQRDVSLSARQWDEARKAVNQARRRLAELDGALALAAGQRHRLERIRRTLPNLARRAQLLELRAGLGEVPGLSAGFGQRRETAVAQRTLALASRSNARTRDADLKEQAAALQVSADLLAEAELIDTLRERLGSHRKADVDRPGLVAERAALAGQAATLLGQLRPDLTLDAAPTLRPLLNRRRRATELGGRQEAVAAAVEQARCALAEVVEQGADRRAAQAALPVSPPLDVLRRATDEARRAGDLERAIGETQARIQRDTDACRRELAALGLWDADLDALRAAPLPSGESIERCIADAQGLDEARRSLETLRAEVEAERRQSAESLRVIQLAGAAPSEADLDQSRAAREHGWQLIKRQWLEGEDIAAAAHAYAAGTALPLAFEGAVAQADEVADRLRREAQRVHEQAAARARLEACEQRLDAAGQAAVRLAQQGEQFQQAWCALWSPCGVVPLPPREMRQWHAAALRLRERAGQGDALAAELGALEATRQGHLRAVQAALDALGLAVPPTPPASGAAALNPLLDQAETQLRALQETERRRDLLAQEIAALEVSQRRLMLEVKTRQDERADWLAAWGALTAELGLAADAGPGELTDYLTGLDTCLKHLGEAERLDARIQGIDADGVQFRDQVDALLARLAPELRGRPVEETVLQLHARLVRQREDQSRRDALTAQSRRAQQEIQQADAAIQAADAMLAELCREAGCTDPDQLAAVEQRVQEHRELGRQLSEVETELVTAGDGLGIEALSEEAGQVDRDAVLAELTALEARIEGELRPQQAALFEQKVEVERQFAAMAGDDAAAALAEEAQQSLSSLRTQGERYVRVKLAARILRDEIERFRRQHRDPILSRASGYFARLTCNAFSAVETDFDTADQPVLTGRRATGEQVRVEGMSTGTRDQLYLALRLANLDHYLDSAEPLPFIVDDILIQFDDARAQATLAALADFSVRTQVILFTHHRQVVDQARALDPGGERVLVHSLMGKDQAQAVRSM